MDISIIVIGDEILLGQVTDTNSGDIARTFSTANWQINRVFTVGDNADEIKAAVHAAMNHSDIVITTGGLGPTKDDITKNVLLDIFGGELVFDNEVLKNVEDVCNRRHIKINGLTRNQAFVPSSAKIIQNVVGTAPIMWFEQTVGGKEKVLVTLPGVPAETSHMIKTAVFPQLLSHFGCDITVSHRNLLVYGITESGIAEMLDTWEDNLPPYLHLAYLPVPGYQKLRLDGVHADADFINNLLDEKVAELKAILGDAVFAEKDAPVAEIALEMLRKHGYTFATAESCTGGNIAHSITLIPGSSDVFLGSVVSYANSVKTNILGVDANTIETLGAVSVPVAKQMASGVIKSLGSDCSVATSGIAGPGGGSPEKPVGTVCIAVHTPLKTLSGTYFFPGNRQRIIERATAAALIELIRILEPVKY